MARQGARHRTAAVGLLIMAVALAATTMAQSPAQPGGVAPETQASPAGWGIPVLKEVAWAANGGEALGFAPWRREDRDGVERWVTSNATEFWEVRNGLVVFGARILPGRKETANRFVIASLLLTQFLAKRHGRTTPDTMGASLVEMAQAAAAAPGKEVQREQDGYLLTLVRAPGQNVWVYSIEPR